MSDGYVLLTICVVYFATVLVIGAVAYRRTGKTAEDYFLGGRTARTVVLFMALFGTNVTPFVLMGIPGLAYHHGVGVFGYNAAIVALGIPLSLYLIGYPAWRAARRIGAITPAELYAVRLQSPALGTLLFAAFAVYTLPYVVTSVLGVGLAVDTLTDAAVSFELAAALILAITIGYTVLGGMRATMWTNVFQGAVFLGFMVVAFFLIATELGGFEAATQEVQRKVPRLLVKGERPMFEPAGWTSWGLAISLTVIAFPHMLVRVFAAKDEHALKQTCRLYPLALVFLWLPAVMFGVWGAAVFEGLSGHESDRVFPLLVRQYLGPGMRGIALAGILAAVMSTIDAQFLTLSSMLGRDVLRRRWPRIGEQREVALGRVFIVVIAIVTYLVVLARPASIFRIASFAFSGYVTLVPTLYLGVRWRQFSAGGAIASIVAGNLVLLTLFLLDLSPGGFLPVAWGFGTAIAAAILGSLRWPPRGQPGAHSRQ